MPDAKLQALANEIDALLKKHDVAGLVLLSNQNTTHYLMQLCPSWSCARMEGPMLRIKCKATEIPDKHRRELLLKNTVSMLMGFIDVATHISDQLKQLMVMVGQSVQFSHWSQLEKPGEPIIDTFTISADGKSITCKRCKRTSYNQSDVEHHYCGHCHVFHDDLWPLARQWWIDHPLG